MDRDGIVGRSDGIDGGHFENAEKQIVRIVGGRGDRLSSMKNATRQYRR